MWRTIYQSKPSQNDTDIRLSKQGHSKIFNCILSVGMDLECVFLKAQFKFIEMEITVSEMKKFYMGSTTY